VASKNGRFPLAILALWRAPQGGASNHLQYRGIRLLAVRWTVGIGYNSVKNDPVASRLCAWLYSLSKRHSGQSHTLNEIMAANYHLLPRSQRGAKASGGSVAERSESGFLLQGNQTSCARAVKEANGKAVLTVSRRQAAPKR
jgi:hypothetical protein